LLEALGINLEGLDPAEQFEALGRALSEMNDKAVASTISTQLLGRSYAEMRPLFKEVIELGKLHATVTEEQSKQAKQLEDNWKKIEQVWTEGARALVSDMVPALDKVAERFLRINQERGWIEALLDLATHPFEKSLKPQIAAGEDVAAGGLALGGVGGAAGGAASAIAKETAEEKAARELRVKAYEKFLRDYPLLIAQEKSMMALYSDQLRLEQELIRDAYILGNIHEEEQIKKLAALEDARLSLLIKSLEREKGFAQKKKDTVEAGKIQEQIELAESQRRTNSRIMQAQVDTVAEQKARSSRTAGGAALADTDKFIENIAFKKRVEEQAYQDELTRLTIFGQLGSEEEQKANAAKQILAHDHSERMVAIAEQERMQRVLIANFTFADLMQVNEKLFGQLSELMSSHSRQLFQVGKVAAIAHTIISTIKSAEDAFAWGMEFGGPPLAFALAAAATVVGLSRVQQIQSTQFGGGSTASPTFAASPGTSIPASQVSAPPTPATQITVNVINQGNIIGPDGTNDFVQNFVLPSLSDAINNNDAILIGTNSRQAAQLTTNP
jgi:hypothetical protein